ncbi:DUF3732 domain-containing protein, partial [Streptomyces violaceorubidus]
TTQQATTPTEPPDLSPTSGNASIAPGKTTASKVQDADRATVTAYFTLLDEVARLNEGTLQIIVSDHANLPEPWFQNAVIANWRPDDEGNRNALIPFDWTP